MANDRITRVQELYSCSEGTITTVVDLGQQQDLVSLSLYLVSSFGFSVFIFLFDLIMTRQNSLTIGLVEFSLGILSNSFVLYRPGGLKTTGLALREVSYAGKSAKQNDPRRSNVMNHNGILSTVYKC